MKRYGNLYKAICDIENIKRAHKNARKGKAKTPEVIAFDKDIDGYCAKIREMLINKTFTTSPYHIFTIAEYGKKRDICELPYYPDRVVQWALLQVVEPCFMSKLIHQTYAALPERGAHSALNKLHEYMTDRAGTRYCLKMDVKKFFQSINREILKAQFRRIFKDPDLLYLLDDIADSYENGIPIGNYTSQYYGNGYLSDFDHWLKQDKRIKYFLRYMDDMIILSDSKTHLHALRVQIENYLRDNLKLTLKKTWQVFPTYTRGVDFVGYRSFGDFTLLRRGTKKNMKAAVKRLRLKQKSGESLNKSDKCTIASYSGILKHCDSYRLRKATLDRIKI